MTEPTDASKPNAAATTAGATTKRSEQTVDLLLDLGLPDKLKSLQNKDDQDTLPDNDTATKRRSSRKTKLRQQESAKQQAELVPMESSKEPDEKPNSNRTCEPDDPSFEQSIQMLSQIVEQLESGELALEQSVKLFEQGMGIVKRCDKQLKNAAQKVQKLIAVDDEGNAHTEPFEA